MAFAWRDSPSRSTSSGPWAEGRWRDVNAGSAAPVYSGETGACHATVVWPSKILRTRCGRGSKCSVHEITEQSNPEVIQKSAFIGVHQRPIIIGRVLVENGTL